MGCTHAQHHTHTHESDAKRDDEYEDFCLRVNVGAMIFSAVAHSVGTGGIAAMSTAARKRARRKSTREPRWLHADKEACC